MQKLRAAGWGTRLPRGRASLAAPTRLSMAEIERTRESARWRGPGGGGGGGRRRLRLQGLTFAGDGGTRWDLLLGAPFNRTPALNLQPSASKTTFQRLLALRSLCTLFLLDTATLSMAAAIYGAQEASRASRATAHNHRSQPIDIACRSRYRMKSYS